MIVATMACSPLHQYGSALQNLACSYACMFARVVVFWDVEVYSTECATLVWARVPFWCALRRAEIDAHVNLAMAKLRGWRLLLVRGSLLLYKVYISQVKDNGRRWLFPKSSRLTQRP